eukprot:gnl/Dysnectes_brevis/2712_a3289_1720.p1 GENE.gnl/Dysnectes_brevis/2712_a3289_1720~~gnl/Dysnectes_brevis/2712_a3289_1720.p1  ORF type:complete len:129 (+),score=16.43 gnl/Dysnectes_brevis/2712_a3289_1720:57-443(+)
MSDPSQPQNEREQTVLKLGGVFQHFSFLRSTKSRWDSRFLAGTFSGIYWTLSKSSKQRLGGVLYKDITGVGGPVGHMGQSFTFRIDTNQKKNKSYYIAVGNASQAQGWVRFLEGKTGHSATTADTAEI